MSPGKRLINLSLGAALLIGLACAVAPLGPRAATRKAADPLAHLHDWDVPQLVSHLEGQGLGLRPVADCERGDLRYGAYLTRTEKDWVQLSRLFKAPERIESWRGTVHCGRLTAPQARDVCSALWGDCCLIAGPFVFFGDRELLAEIRAGLSRGGRAE
jgi:hypothetical protein